MKKGLLLFIFLAFAIAHAATLPDMLIPNSNYYIADFTFTDGVDSAAFSWNYIPQAPPFIALSLTNIPAPLDVTFLVALFPQVFPPIQTLTAGFTASTLPGTVTVDMSHIYDVVIPKTGLPSSGERVTITIPGTGLESGTVKLPVSAPEPRTYSLVAGAVGLVFFFKKGAIGKEKA